MSNFKSNLKVKMFGYDVIKTEPLDNLYKYKEHRRLRVYYHKGTTCSNPECGRDGAHLVHSKDKKGNIHIDLVTDNMIPMTIDHIYPKSKGGTNYLVNLEPMCYICNREKSNIIPKIEILPGMINPNWIEPPIVDTLPKKKKIKPRKKNIQVGDLVYKKSGKGRKTFKFMGKVINIRPNEHHPMKALCAQIEGMDENSLYNLSCLYIL